MEDIGTDTIRELECDILDTKCAIEQIEERLHEIHRGIAMMIERKHLDEKPPELSNAQKRTEAVELLMQGNHEVETLREKQKELELELRLKTIDLEYEHRKFKREYMVALMSAAQGTR